MKPSIEIRSLETLVSHFAAIELKAGRGLEDVKLDSYEGFLTNNMSDAELANTEIVTLWSETENHIKSELKRKYGTVKFEGTTYYLKQNSYADNYDTNPTRVCYYAYANDEAGNVYLVRWDTTEMFDLSSELYNLEHSLSVEPSEDDIARKAELVEMGIDSSYCEDESEACDWENPSDVKEI